MLAVCVKLSDTRLSSPYLPTPQVHPNGEIVLDTGGTKGILEFQALNQALNKINIKIVSLGEVEEGNWNVSDGRSLQRFEDGMVVPAKLPVMAARGRLLLRSYNVTPAATTAQARASAASTAAAVKAGILPAAAAAGAEGEDEGQRESAEEARKRRLRAQGRYQPY